MKYDITESEWSIMELLWEREGLLIGEIRDGLTDTGWSYSTIKTLVGRLEQKEIIRAEQSDKGKKYYTNVNAEECKAKETKHFLSRVYNGSVKMMVASLVKDTNLNEKDINKIISLIDKIEE